MIESDQTGSAFGSAFATCDVDGDGVDELLVGAQQRRGTRKSLELYDKNSYFKTSSCKYGAFCVLKYHEVIEK